MKKILIFIVSVLFIACQNPSSLANNDNTDFHILNEPEASVIDNGKISGVYAGVYVNKNVSGPFKVVILKDTEMGAPWYNATITVQISDKIYNKSISVGESFNKLNMRFVIDNSPIDFITNLTITNEGLFVDSSNVKIGDISGQLTFIKETSYNIAEIWLGSSEDSSYTFNFIKHGDYLRGVYYQNDGLENGEFFSGIVSNSFNTTSDTPKISGTFLNNNMNGVFKLNGTSNNKSWNAVRIR